MEAKPHLRVATSFVGASGTDAFDTIGDWTAKPYRVWGLPAAKVTDTATRGRCTAGTCQLWDLRIPAEDTILRGERFVKGAPCPTSASYVDTRGNDTFLVAARERLFDGIGDEDGLCESCESCMYSPSFGAYQGESAPTIEPCVFRDGSVRGVDLRAFTSAP